MVKKEIRQGVLWKGGFYRRKGSNTWRSSNTGDVFNKEGDYLGPEPVRRNYYGKDVKKKRKKHRETFKP